jgi:hypothetical protein
LLLLTWHPTALRHLLLVTLCRQPGGLVLVVLVELQWQRLLVMQHYHLVAVKKPRS